MIAITKYIKKLLYFLKKLGHCNRIIGSITTPEHFPLKYQYLRENVCNLHLADIDRVCAVEFRMSHCADIPVYLATDGGIRSTLGFSRLNKKIKSVRKVRLSDHLIKLYFCFIPEKYVL